MANPNMPFMDVNELLAQFKVPGVDINALMEARRKDIEALVTATARPTKGCSCWPIARPKCSKRR